MERKEYNGWTNYETWNLALWIDNERGSYEYWRDQSREAYRDSEARPHERRVEDAALRVSRQLQADTEENMPGPTAEALQGITGFYADILQAAVAEVNWYEIAKSWVEEVADDIDAEETAEAAE